MIKFNRLIRLLFLLLIAFAETEVFFAQDSFNTNLLFESTQPDGEMIDAIVRNCLKVYELENCDSLRQKSLSNKRAI